MLSRTIDIVNQSRTVTQGELGNVLTALRGQVERHFAPHWGGLSCRIVHQTRHNPDRESILLVDDDDWPGVLGYHSLDRGVPAGVVDVRESGRHWPATLSHELLEQLVDPYCQTAVVVPFLGRPAAVAYEVCDPVSGDTYPAFGFELTSFVLPSWFCPDGKAPYDILGRLDAPLTLGPGGYAPYSRDLQSWQSAHGLNGATAKAAHHRSIRRK